MTARSLPLVQAYLALLRQDDLDPSLIGPIIGGHGSADQLGRLLASSQAYVTDPLAGLSALQDILNRRVAEVEAAARSLHLPLNEQHVVTGLYPLGDVNAWTTPATDGDLILMGSGAMGLIFLTIKINLMSSQMFGQPALVSRSETVNLLADVFAAHFRVGDPWRAPRVPRLDRQRETMLALLVNAAERFVIGHEYGHVVGMHAHSDRIRLRTTSTDVEVYTRLWEDEFEADRIGADLVLAEQRMAATAERDPQLERRHPLAAAAAATGPMYFLLLDMVLHQLHGELNVLGYPPASTSHPPSEQRWDALWPVIEREYGHSSQKQPPLHLPAALMEWYDRLLNDLTPAIGARLGKRRLT